MIYIYRDMEGFQEAAAPPSMHGCESDLLDATISERRLVLICYDCDTYWHTGLREKPSFVPSMPKLERAAEHLYQLSQYQRMPILRQARENEVQTMYNSYRMGRSLAQVGALYGISRQSVYDKFKARGFKLRSRRRLPKITWNGQIYARSGKGGFYRRTGGERSLLHRDKWELHCGPIPDGHEVHHIDGDPANNDLSNLVCVPREEALARHRIPATDTSNPPTCMYCGSTLKRKVFPSGVRECPSALMRRRYCNRRCFHAHRWEHVRTGPEVIE